jgi:predicted lipid-binding transport protein (Tim44 family)
MQREAIHMSIRRVATTRSLMAALAALGVVALGVDLADAQAGRGRSTGSRGSQTFTAPPSTNTAPKAAQPIQRSTVQPGMAGRAAAPAQSRFGSGFGGMLMGGLLGAGLFGLLSGSGLFGGAAGLAGMLGLLLQVALIAGIVWLAVSFFRRRSAPATATPMGRQGMVSQGQPYASTPAGGFAQPAAAAPAVTQPLALEQADYEAFERLLVRIQDSYGREDVPALRAIATSEMASYFAEDIAENQRKGIHNLVSDAKLLQGDLSEAWREADAEYATVAMRFSLLSTDVERGTGRILSGSSERPIELTEIWTFVRRPGSNANGWKLSAIQQTA